MLTETTPLVVNAATANNGTDAPSASSWTTNSRLWSAGIVVVVVVLVVGGAAFYGGTKVGEGGTAPAAAWQQHHQNNNNDNGSKYVGTQFISFTINTIGGIASRGECDDGYVNIDKPVDPTNGFCYLGNADNITEDIYHRLHIVEDVLRKIKSDVHRKSPDIDHQDTVLKIVMLPEFFWRGPHGAYSINLIASPLFIQMSDQLRALVADPFFTDYLFVFGTVIAADVDVDTTTGTITNHDDNIEYYNLASVHMGGPTASHRHHYIVTKKYISGADFLSRTTLPNPKNNNQHAYDAVRDSDKMEAVLVDKRNMTIITDNIIDLDGIRIGLEICLDHRMGALWDHLHRKHLPLVDVLLVTSAGMAIERGPNPIVPGGVVYLSDGEASSAACLRTDDDDSVFRPETVCRGEVGGLKHVPIASGGPGGYTSFFALSACWDMEKEKLLRGYYSQYQPQGCAHTLKMYDIDVMDDFTYYPPSIEIYPTVALPA